MEEVRTEGLKRWMDENWDFVLIDVLGAEAHEAWRLPNSVNACVYEVAFLDKVKAPLNARIVVYGSSEDSQDSAEAAKRLEAAGFTNVFRYTGGRAAWQAAGHPHEGSADRWDPRPPVTVRDGLYALDPENSFLEWTGRNIGNRHYGMLRFAGGKLQVKDGVPTEAAFDLDLESITVGDLQGEMAQALVRHLESEDFFFADEFPVASVAMRAVTPIDGATAGEPNFRFAADLTMRGLTAPLAFDASLAHRGEDVALQTNFDFDRTQWGVNYGSGKVFEHLGGHVVADRITAQVTILAVPS